MEIQNNSLLNFKASVSPQVKYQLYNQLSTHGGKKQMARLLDTKLEDVSRWGSSDSEIVIAKDYRGKYRLGLQYNVTPNMKFSMVIKGKLAKTELSQFLALKEADIIKTENTIKYLYAKFGSGYFARFKK